MNYLELGRVAAWRAYTWLGVHSFILAGRFALWAIQPSWLSSRYHSVLYSVSGSLVKPLEEDGPVSEDNLSQDVVRFAVASACSKILPIGGKIGNIQLSALDILSGIAPADILRAEYCNISSLRVTSGGTITALRLPWSWVEEIYVAQGLILGHNPWALGGLHLAAIVQNESECSPWIFRGLTTVHPRGAGADQAHGEDTYQLLEKSDIPSNVVSISVENYGISGTLFMGTIVERLPTPHGLMDWHDAFRRHVKECRDTAVSNGPLHHELRISNFGVGLYGNKRVTKTVESMQEVLDMSQTISEKEMIQDHSRCKEFCNIFGF
jgi:hypothetical protein